MSSTSSTVRYYLYFHEQKYPLCGLFFLMNRLNGCFHCTHHYNKIFVTNEAISILIINFETNLKHLFGLKKRMTQYGA